MSKAKRSELVTQVLSEIKIDKDDLIAIQVSEVETELMKQQAETDILIHKADKDVRADEKTLGEGIEVRIEKMFGQDIERAVKALKAIGATATKVLNLTRNDQQQRVEINMGVSPEGNYGSITVNRKVPYDAGEKKQVKAIETKQERIKALRERAVEIRKRLSQLGTLERQAKAAMARDVLNRSAEGKELLAQVSQIPGLPALPNLKDLK